MALSVESELVLDPLSGIFGQRFEKIPDVSELQIRKKLETVCNQEPSLNTLRARTSLAQELLQLSLEEEKLCKERIHEQHLQQQVRRVP